jgi:hypothetical protein
MKRSPDWLVNVARDWMSDERAVQALRSRVFEALDNATENGCMLDLNEFDAIDWAQDLAEYSSSLEDVSTRALALFANEWRRQKKG